MLGPSHIPTIQSYFSNLPADIKHSTLLMSVHSGTSNQIFDHFNSNFQQVADSAQKQLTDLFNNDSDKLNLYMDKSSRSYLLKALIQFNVTFASMKDYPAFKNNLKAIIHKLIVALDTKYNKKMQKYPIAKFIEFLLQNPDRIESILHNQIKVFATDESYGPFFIQVEDTKSIFIEKKRTGSVSIYLNETNLNRQTTLSLINEGKLSQVLSKCGKKALLYENGVCFAQFKPFEPKNMFELNAQGNITFSNGDIFTGTLKNGYPHKGTMIYIKGFFLSNVWKDIMSCNKADSLNITAPVTVKGTFPTIPDNVRSLIDERNQLKYNLDIAISNKEPDMTILLTLKIKKLNEKIKALLPDKSKTTHSIEVTLANNAILKGDFDFLSGAFQGKVNFTSSLGSRSTQLWLDNGLQKRQDYQSETIESYYGEMHNGLPHGLGLIKFKNRSEYYGDVRLGQPSGHGTMTYANGFTYTGNFYEGNREGNGHFGNGKGYKFSGEWKNNKPLNGHEIHTHIPSGLYFNGEWKDGKQWNGSGRLITHDRKQYEGEIMNGKPHGEGIWSIMVV